MKFAILKFPDRVKEQKAAMKFRMGKFIYVDQVFETSREAKRFERENNSKWIDEEAPPATRKRRMPIGVLEDVEQFTGGSGIQMYKGRLTKVDYNQK